MIDAVDPFIGTEAIGLPQSEGLSASWFYIKAQIGNTHPGPSLPFGPMSATAYSGGYPTGYGTYDVNTHGQPGRLYDNRCAYGATHMQHSGTGYTGVFYNYLLTVPFRKTPAIAAIDLRQSEPYLITDESAAPGHYSATLPEVATRMELTAGRFAAAHRYSFLDDANTIGSIGSPGILVDITQAGLAPARAQSRAEHITISIEHDVVSGSCVLYGVRWYFALITSSVGTGTPVLWNSESVAEREADRVKNGWCNATALAPGKQLERSAEECAATRFGVMWPTVDGKAVEIFVGLSQESTSKAVQYVGDAASCGFDGMHAHAQNTWQQYFDRVRITGGSAKTRRIFATAWYHAGLKPVRSERTNFLWSDDHELWSDLATMWDQYKTQLPYLLTVFPEHSQSLAESLLATSRVLGQFPNAVLFTPNLKKFENQSRLLAVVTLFDIYRHLSIKGTINYDTWRATAETMSKAVELESEKISPNKGEQAFSHLLDLSYAAGCVRTLSAELGLNELVAEMSRCEKRWREAFDPETGMMHKGSYYEGGNIHYSFRLLHDMGARIELCGGADAFNERLDEFFGFGADPVSQIGDGIEQQTGIELGRFDGLNNEIMLETPFAYHYIGKPDRTSQIIHAIQRYQWGDTAGGIPGNDDSGALSSWYFWNTVGLFPLSGQDIFFISTPLFDRVEIGSCGFVIEAERGDANTSDGSIYIESVELNGKLLDRSFLFLREVLEGGVLRLRLSRERGRFRPGRLPQDRIK